MIQAVMGLVRTVLAALLGGLVASGNLSDGDMNTIIGAVGIILTAAWSWLSKRKTNPPT